MSNQNKPRLSDIAKKNTVDRASKLATGFIPAPPAPVVPPPAETSQPAPQAQTPADIIEPGEQDFTEGIEGKPSVDELKETVNEKAAPAAKPAPVVKERTRRSSGTIDLADMVSQPVPDNLRCTRMIMLADEHHDMLRELSFHYKKPMTAILYNLLEPAHQALQRDKKKGD